MPYRTWGARSAKGAADTTGLNPGNWTVTFDVSALGLTMPEFEVNKIFVTGAAAGATISAIYVNTAQWDGSVYATLNSWSANGDPLVLRPGDVLYFLYSSAASDGHQPQVTIWLREELSLSQLYGRG